MSNLLFINKVSDNREAFAAKVADVAARLGIEPDWLMAVMNSESALDSKAVNKQGASSAGYGFKDGKKVILKQVGTPDSTDAFTRSQYRATGLIQFMPATAAGLGTTTQAIYKMTNVQQLDYVYKYFVPYKGKLKNYADLYLATFYPRALEYNNHVGKEKDNYVIGMERGEDFARLIAKQNPFDMDGDGLLTINDFKTFINKKLPNEALARFGAAVKETVKEVAKTINENKGASATVFMLLAAAATTYAFTR